MFDLITQFKEIYCLMNKGVVSLFFSDYVHIYFSTADVVIPLSVSTEMAGSECDQQPAEVILQKTARACVY